MLYKLGTTEDGKGLSLKPEDFYSHKLMNKISKQLQVCVLAGNFSKKLCNFLILCVSLGPPGIVQWLCTHMVPHHMHNVSDTDTIQRTPKLVPFHRLWNIKVPQFFMLTEP